ncbi:ribonucleoside-diphosphate reductase subunit alpha [Cupriavidus campinensis]|nr:ribonucleoside-diphosphate reductase subunit alpha [Cupriavidus campinensis]
MNVIKRSGSVEPFNPAKIERKTRWACQGLDIDPEKVMENTVLGIRHNMPTSEIGRAQAAAAADMISVDCQDATFLAARYLLADLYKEVTGEHGYGHLADYIHKAVALELLDDRLGKLFDLKRLNIALQPNRDLQFTYLGLQTVADRYLIREPAQAGSGTQPIIELPQHFFMRVAMGLALLEDNPTERAIEFYETLSSFDFMSSTPTLFNSGTRHSQMSSCYLNTVADNLSADESEESNRYASIYGTLDECARLSKFAGGIGTDWTRVRSAGDPIKSTNGKSSGVVPYLKVQNDTAVAVNQGGKRNGAIAAYLETWHPDLYDFLELKKNSGDNLRRTYELFPANWIPDLFMKRVQANDPSVMWSFFSPAEFPELHELYGAAFEARYVELEQAGRFRFQKPVLEVWRKMVQMLFETGNPWMTWKDECNRRNPQDHVGVIHGSNLCTEITLNTSDDETAVCNLGSVNLARHLTNAAEGKVVLDSRKLRKTIRTAMRMLDNVIDLNFYPSFRARNANLRHRPVGLGVMGYTEALVACGVHWESKLHLLMADVWFEAISYFAIEASSDLAAERGAYTSYKGSKWDRGIFPIDTARDQAATMNWTPLREKVAKQGMRNSNTMAIAPTATISNIVGTTPCIEPIFKRTFTEGNLSGSFMVVDPSLKYGRPDLCLESFEVDQIWVIDSAARRQKWIDQAQSVNIFAKAGVKGKDLSAIYLRAWERGLKTTYYLRPQTNKVKESAPEPAATPEPEVQFCSISSPDCESCQ